MDDRVIRNRGSDTKEPLRLWLRLMATTSLISGELAGRLRRHFGVSFAQFDYLAQLYRSAGRDLAMNELGRLLMVTSGNVTGLTDRLQRLGWVVRERAAHDRRTQYVRLTPAGRTLFETMAAAHEDWVGELVGTLAPTEREALLDLLGQLRRSATAALESN